MAKKPPAKKSPASRPPAKRPPAKVSSGRPAGLFTWIAVALVLVIVVTLVIVKVATNSTASGSGAYTAAGPTLVDELTQIPDSVFSTVGITSPDAQIVQPQAISGQTKLTGKSSTGATLPMVFYEGAEYCPFCAAQRWPMIIAMSRFGSWSGLGLMESSTLSGEVYPGTPTFTFLKSTYTSKYLVFSSVERYTNVYSSSLGFYTPLQTPAKWQTANFEKYDTSKWIKGMSSDQDGSIPFISIGNKFLVSGSSYTPATLTSLTRDQVATGLSDPTSPVTDAIIASANYLTEAFCTLTKGQPGSVCDSPGVLAAKKAMGIK